MMMIAHFETAPLLMTLGDLQFNQGLRLLHTLALSILALNTTEPTWQGISQALHWLAYYAQTTPQLVTPQSQSALVMASAVGQESTAGLTPYSWSRAKAEEASPAPLLTTEECLLAPMPQPPQGLGQSNTTGEATA
jgi:hypothetical protein